jgi:hypothetical protein
MKSADLAYIKAVLHAFKHPSDAVCGLLLGKMNGNTLQVIDSIPLFHSQLTLMPMIDVALTQVKAACQDGNKVVGYYVANESLTDDTLSAHASRIANRVKDSFKDAVVWQIINARVPPKSDSLAITVYASSGKGWSPSSADNMKIEFVKDSEGEYKAIDTNEVFAGLRKSIEEFAFKELVDFDDHLADIQGDIWNVNLGDRIKKLVA